MKPTEISAARLASQLIGAREPIAPAAAVAHLTAMQAQDLSMAKWAIGIRGAAATESEVNAAIDSGDIIRTHALRPTWHLLANKDVDWILKLTAPQILVAMRSRHKQLGLDEKIINRCKKVAEKALLTADALTRTDMIAALKRARIILAPECYSHILLRCELDRLICSGPVHGSDTTYALYSRQVHTIEHLPHDEALGRLAQRYFKSHAPATLEDFTWWSGLKVSDARRAVSVAADYLEKITAQETTWYLVRETRKSAVAGRAFLLPAFDEFIIGYADRSAALPKGLASSVISSNGIFRAVILQRGLVCGLWKRTIKNNRLVLSTESFTGRTASFQRALLSAATDLANFYRVALVMS